MSFVSGNRHSVAHLMPCRLGALVYGICDLRQGGSQNLGYTCGGDVVMRSVDPLAIDIYHGVLSGTSSQQPSS